MVDPWQGCRDTWECRTRRAHRVQDERGVWRQVWRGCYCSPVDRVRTAQHDQGVRIAPTPVTLGVREGPAPRIIVSTGCIAVSRPDAARHERTRQRAEEKRQRRVDDMARTMTRCWASSLRDLLAAGRDVLLSDFYASHGQGQTRQESGREVTKWSKKSRLNMRRAFACLDYAPMLADPTRLPAMVTLTYPGDWLTVAPTGKAVKRHLEAFKLRYQRAWDAPVCGLWKLEFQDRGAPHFHLFLVPPHGLAGTARREQAKRYRPAVGDGFPFREWLSAVWADIVNHPDPVERMNHERAGTGVDFAEGMRYADPQRISTYFSKDAGRDARSSKEYQHIVPAQWQGPGQGPGRFWGYWTLERAESGRVVRPIDAVRAARIVRRYSRSQGVTHEVQVWRTPGGTVRRWDYEVVGLAGAQLVESRRARRRRVRRPVRRLANGAGWLAVNDGPAFARSLGKALAIWAA